MAVSITNIDVSALETVTDFLLDAATADVANTAEVFTITPDPHKQGGRCAIAIKETSGAGTMTFSLAAGEHWAHGVALTGNIVQSKTWVFVIETAKYKKLDGTMVLTLTPAAGQKLLADHAAEVGFLELF